ncbi:hypothetical protein GW17_00001959 [Ensete ventricosum]|nr:hypothetical protein GW17_00001959 [Ensete ventricosum]
MAEQARMRRVTSVPSSNSSPARHSTMLLDCEEEDQNDSKSEKGKQQSNLSQGPFLPVDRDLPDHRSHDPSTPYHVLPDRARTRPLLHSAWRNEDLPSIVFRPTKHFFVSRHVQLPSPSCLLHLTGARASSSSSSCSSFWLPIDIVSVAGGLCAGQVAERNVSPVPDDAIRDSNP